MKAGAVFVNLTVAYDIVWHRGLTCKLLRVLPDIGVGSGGSGGALAPPACKNALISRQNFVQFLIFRAI